MNCSVEPFTSDELGALMAMVVNGRVVTLSKKLFDVMPLKLALMLAPPTATAVAKPVTLMVAIAEVEEAHTTCDVMLAVEPSL